MPMVTIFDGCAIVVEETPLPNGEAGKSIVIIDQAGSKQHFRYPMNIEQAKQVGGQLMGLGDLVVPTALEQFPPRNGRRK